MEDPLPLISHCFGSKMNLGKAIISGHIAKANSQWKAIPEAGEVLVMFQGPHALHLFFWYNHENVPNLELPAVHVYWKNKMP